MKPLTLSVAPICWSSDLSGSAAQDLDAFDFK
eukprot:COSAG04_NODE_30540_length_262_cov_0.631902_1_plen_31_part_01